MHHEKILKHAEESAYDNIFIVIIRVSYEGIMGEGYSICRYESKHSPDLLTATIPRFISCFASSRSFR